MILPRRALLIGGASLLLPRPSRAFLPRGIISVGGPVLSAPTGARTPSSAGGTNASLSVSTDTGAGTLYWVLSTSATPPTPTQIQAGQDSSGSPAPVSGNQAVSATGVQNASTSSAAIATKYYAYFNQKNGAAVSNVASSSQFNTGGGLTITATYDTNTGTPGSPGSALSGQSFTAAQWFAGIQEFINLMQTQFCASAFTAFIQFGYGTLNNVAIGGSGLGVNQAAQTNVPTYAAWKTAITSKAITTNASNFISHLPGSDPIGGGLQLNSLLAAWLGIGGPYTHPHHFIGINTEAHIGANWTCTQAGSIIGADLVGTCGHETSEGWGRFVTVNPVPGFVLPQPGNYCYFTHTGGTMITSGQPAGAIGTLDQGATNNWSTGTMQTSGDAFDIIPATYSGDMACGAQINQKQLLTQNTINYLDAMGLQSVL